MARSPRIFFPGAIYHVYCRTARGEMVFSDPLDAHEFVDTVADIKRLHGFLVLGWCLMSNHYHLLVQTLKRKRCLGTPDRLSVCCRRDS
jgi:REP element-mobilizing transposase RayT